MSGVLSPSAYGYAQTGQNALNMLNSLQNYQANRFALQQAQLQPALSGLMGLVGKPDVTQDDILHNLAKSQRLGADVSGIASDLTEAMAQGMTPAEFVRQFAIRNIPAFEQAQMVGGRLVQRAVPGGVATVIERGPFGPGGPGYSAIGGGGAAASPATQAPAGAAAAPSGDGGTVDTDGWDTGAPAPSTGPGAQGLVGPPGAAGVSDAVRGVGAGALPWSHNPFLNALASAESGNRNIPSEVDPGTPQEVSQGYFQINTPTAQQYARQAGVNLGGRSAMQLKPEEQMALVQQIPFSRFGPRTQRMLQREFGSISPSATIGQLAARFDQGGAPVQVAQNQVGQPVVTDVGAGGPAVVSGAGPTPVQNVAYTPAYGPYRVDPTSPFIPDVGPYQTQQNAATARSQGLQNQMQASIQMRPLLSGMEDELDAMIKSGAGSRVNSTLRQVLVNAGLANQQGQIAETQAAQEQFNKFAQIIAGQTLQTLGNASNDRQTMAQESNPGLELSYLGNKGILHMLQGQQQAVQVMGRAWQDFLNRGGSPGLFDQWRADFTAPDQNGGRFDPRIFWMANMTPEEQKIYWDHMKDRPAEQQLMKRNMDYAEQRGWITATQGGGFTSPF